jgi:putative transposase
VGPFSTSISIAEDDHLLTVLRYIERNPVRANLVERAEDWRWSSASPRTGEEPELDLGPVRRGDKWLDFVNTPQTEAEVKRIRECVRRGRPYGATTWAKKRGRSSFLKKSCVPFSSSGEI